jgi:hypothetical protein
MQELENVRLLKKAGRVSASSKVVHAPMLERYLEKIREVTGVEDLFNNAYFVLGQQTWAVDELERE